MAGGRVAGRRSHFVAGCREILWSHRTNARDQLSYIGYPLATCGYTLRDTANSIRGQCGGTGSSPAVRITHESVAANDVVQRPSHGVTVESTTLCSLTAASSSHTFCLPPLSPFSPALAAT